MSKKPALIYCRVSTRIQEEEGTSLDSQEAACVKHAESLGYSVGRVTRERYSGAELWDRPKLSVDREDIRAGKFGGLVAYSTDRLSRDPIHLAIIADDCERGGAELIFVTEPLDNSDEGRLLQYVKGYANKKEREKIRERSMRGRYQRALNGKVTNSGTDLYGYRRQDGVRIIFEPEAAVVRRIYYLVAMEHRSCHAVAKLLNAEGVPTPIRARLPERPTYWRGCAVWRIIRQVAYKGEGYAWHWVQVKRPGKAPTSVPRAPEKRVKLPEGTVPAIVSPELWQAAQDAVQAQSGNHTRNEKLPYLLRGLIFCDLCEAQGKRRRMYGAWQRRIGNDPHSGKIRIYRCSAQNTPIGKCGAHNIHADDIEAWVWGEAHDQMRHPERIKAEVKRRREHEPNDQLARDLEKAKRHAAQLDAQQQEYIQRYTERQNETFPWALVEREVTRLEREKQGWLNTAEEIEQRIAMQSATTNHLEYLADYCTRLAGDLESMNIHERVDALAALRIKVFANGNRWRLEGGIALEDDLSPTPVR
jgi:site-specific DNA recombinase